MLLSRGEVISVGKNKIKVGTSGRNNKRMKKENKDTKKRMTKQKVHYKAINFGYIS